MAGNALIGALRITLGMESASFEAGAKRAESTSKRLTNALSAPRNAVSALTGTLGAVASALALNEFVGAAKRAFDFADAIADLSDRTGASTKLIQEFRYAAQLSGSSVETADVAMDKFAKTLGLAQGGSKAQVELFKSLGVTSRDFDGALRQTMDGLAKLPSIQQRNSTALQIFGKSASTLVGLMGQGTKGFDELATAASNLGIVLEDEVIRNAGKANDKLDQMKMILDAQFANAVAKNTDSIMSLANAFLSLASAAASAFEKMNIARNIDLQNNTLGMGFVAGKLTGRTTQQVAADARKANLATRAGREAEWARATTLAEKQEIARAEVAARRAASQSAKPKITPGEGFTASPSGGKPKRDNGAEKAASEAKRAAEERRRNQERYDDELTSMTERQLGLEEQLTSDAAEKAKLANQRLDVEREQYVAEIGRRQKDGELTDAQAKRLLAAQAYNDTLERTAIDQQLADDLTRQEVEQRDASLTLQTDLLRGDLAGARTQEERRRIQLKLLDLEYDRQRAALEAVLALNSSTDAERAIAKARLAQLDALKSGEAGQITRDTQGPLAQYLDRLPRDAKELNEAYEQVAADGLQSINDGLVEAIMNSKSLGDVFKRVTDQIVADLLRIAIQKAIMKGLGNAVSGIFGGGDSALFAGIGQSAGDASAAVLGSPTPDFSLPGMARGGSFTIKGNRGLDRNVLSINGSPVARVMYGENVKVGPANDLGPDRVARVEIVENPAFASRVVSISDGVAVTRIGSAQQSAQRRSAKRLA